MDLQPMSAKAPGLPEQYKQLNSDPHTLYCTPAVAKALGINTAPITVPELTLHPADTVLDHETLAKLQATLETLGNISQLGEPVSFLGAVLAGADLWTVWAKPNLESTPEKLYVSAKDFAAIGDVVADLPGCDVLKGPLASLGLLFKVGDVAVDVYHCAAPFGSATSTPAVVA